MEGNCLMEKYSLFGYKQVGHNSEINGEKLYTGAAEN